MKLLTYRFISSNFFKFFVATWLLLSLFMTIITLLSTFTQYLDYGLTVREVLLATACDFPKYSVFCMPYSALLSSAYLFGKMNSDGELLGFMTLGYPMLRLIIPQLAFACVLTIADFVIAETITIKANNKNHELLAVVHNQKKATFSVFRRPGSLFYASEYNTDDERFVDVTIIFFDKEGTLTKRIDAHDATWTGENWKLSSVRILYNDKLQQGEYLSEMIWDGQPTLEDIAISAKTNLENDLFKAYQQILLLKHNVMPYRKELHTFIRRFAKPFTIILFCFVPLILTMQRGTGVLYSAGAHFSLACIYTVVDMLFEILAKNGTLNALQANIFPFIICMLGIVGIYVYRATIAAQITALDRLRRRLFTRKTPVAK